ncbi:hypothetical protein pdul_cds_456 [Pandoravirus dulcis]|uniref:Uncharacterized protein n=1 Tax=Pandoravirus dulcis TaxID=1349409 RepID=S4VQI5_9VIRU|nr:hypothetical protein pdul_cds_456 [Pandoravirus dulcis]AGO82522.1 hypothetical protein pdul_cds_456 [Pandoravirus dulcis]
MTGAVALRPLPRTPCSVGPPAHAGRTLSPNPAPPRRLCAFPLLCFFALFFFFGRLSLPTRRGSGPRPLPRWPLFFLPALAVLLMRDPVFFLFALAWTAPSLSLSLSLSLSFPRLPLAVAPSGRG